MRGLARRRDAVSHLVIIMWILAFLAGAAAASAQDRPETGILFGRVIDDRTGDAVVGASVTVAAPGVTIATDVSGGYRFTGLPPGMTEVLASKPGFAPVRVASVIVVAGTAQELDLPLARETDVISLEALTVEADVLEGSGLGLAMARQKSATVSDAIGSDQFGALGLGDAAEAMTRVTGASLVDGRYVLIRGLGDRYANTLMNGVALPTADPDRRAVQMDQFPTGLIDSIVTTKSFTPDQPGAFAGGSVNLRTRTFPDHLFFSASGSVEYVAGATGEEVLHARGLRSVPVVPDRIPGRTEAELAGRQGDLAPARALDAATRAFGDAPILPDRRTADPNIGFSGAFGNRHDYGSEGVFGYTAAVTYEREFSHATGGEENRFVGTAVAVQPRLLLTGDPALLSFAPEGIPAGTPPWGVTTSTTREALGLMAKLGWRPTVDHELSFDLYHSDVTDDTLRRGVGEEAVNYSGNVFEVYDLLFTDRAVDSAQLSGRSVFPSLNELELGWRASFSRSAQDQPDYRTLSAVYDFGGGFINATGVQPNRYFRELEEESSEAGFDLTYPWVLPGGEWELRWKSGVVASRSERDYREQRFQYMGNPSSREQLEQYPNPVGLLGDTTNPVSFGRVISRLQEPNTYAGEQEINAAYAMIDGSLGRRWRVITGARFERTELHTAPVQLPGLAPREGRLDESQWLPALSLVYAPSARTNWRFAYGRTLARPTFKELTDIRYEDVFTDDVYLGNPDLVLSTIDNLDLRWEWFPRKGETVAVSGFYKDLDRPIEVLFRPSAGSIQPQNVARGRVFGAEVEFRRELGFITPSLQAFSFGANLALVHSEVVIPEEELALLRSFAPLAEDQRDLLGQSPYVLNLDLSWISQTGATTATVTYNVVGERLALVNYGPLPDVYEQPAPRLDLIVSRRLGAAWRLKLAAKNLLDPRHERTLQGDAREYVWSRSRSGRSFSVSVSYLFE